MIVVVEVQVCKNCQQTNVGKSGGVTGFCPGNPHNSTHNIKFVAAIIPVA